MAGLIAIDLDGTLLGAFGELSDRNAAALAQAAEAGWSIVLATGRPPHLTTHLAPQLAGTVGHVVGANGSIVATFPSSPDGQPELLHLASFDFELAVRMVRDLRSVDDGYRFAIATDQGFAHEDGFADRMPAAVAGAPVDDALSIGGTEAFKLLVFHDQHDVHEVSRRIPPVVRATLDAIERDGGDAIGDFAVSHMGADAAEIGPAATDKGAGLRWLCDHLGVPAADVVAFGDELNDITMLRWAGTAYAMENAAFDVKAAADHVAPHHVDDGVGQVVEELLRRSA